MAVTSGKPEIAIGLVDGPVRNDHPDIAEKNIKQITASGGTCNEASSAACDHGTFIAGILVAKRGAPAPAICPGCTLLVRPIFFEDASESMPRANPNELAAAILDCVRAGASVVNLSSSLAQPSTQGEQTLEAALDYARQRGTIVIAAAGNQSAIGSTAITRHPWVISVAACDAQGRPLDYSNFGHSIGRRGLRAPGADISSLAPKGKSVPSFGTSIAAPFVTGTAGLLWSEFPRASAAQIKVALAGPPSARRKSIVPPLLDAWAAYLLMRAHSSAKAR
jgi:subtilisin family serine protease